MVYAEIISGLWIGNVDMMYNKQFINDNNINIIINCTINFKFNEYPNIRNIRIPLTDVLIQNIDLLRNNKDKILSYIDKSLNDNNILICCYDGVTISPFILSLYLIHYGNIDKNKIKQIIQSKNSTISMDYDLSLLDL
jgi:hypothetical protein